VEEHFKIKVTTPTLSFVYIVRQVEEHFKIKVTTPLSLKRLESFKGWKNILKLR